jgi:acyl-CoA thioester hydrolase
MAKTDFAFRHAMRVRWSETDAQGVVFNARYLDYADVAVTEYWRALGFRAKYPDEPFECHIKKATVLWAKPIKPDELIEVMARTTHVGTTSMTQMVEIHGSTADGSNDLRAEVELVAVHVDLATHRPVPLPAWAREEFAAFDKRVANGRVSTAGEVK